MAIPPQAQQAPQGILGMLGIEKRDPNSANTQSQQPFYQRDRFRDTMGNVATGLNSLRLQPDQQLGQRMQESRQGRQQDAQTNRTIEWLGRQPNGAALVDMASSVGIQQALAAHTADATATRAAATNPMVQSSSMLADGSGSVLTMKDGTLSVVTAGGETISGDAAMDFVKFPTTSKKEAIQGLLDAEKISNSLREIDELRKSKENELKLRMEAEKQIDLTQFGFMYGKNKEEFVKRLKSRIERQLNKI